MSYLGSAELFFVNDVLRLFVLERGTGVTPSRGGFEGGHCAKYSKALRSCRPTQRMGDYTLSMKLVHEDRQ
jgi:hypothetical protein